MTAPPARTAVTDAAWRAGGVDLPAVTATAALQTRVDRKYLLTTDAFARLAPALADHLRALEIGGRRVFGYASVYFDTPDLLTYRQHLQGRRRRYKIRTRTYTDSGDCLLEVKCAGGREETIKHRAAHPFADRARLTAAGRAFVATALDGTYGLPVPPGLRAVLTTTYHRATFADPAAGIRVTCDTGLTITAPGAPELHAAPDLVIVEVKAATAGSPLERELRHHGLRPITLSKYCVAVAALRGYGWGPRVAANPWHQVTRRLALH